MEKTFYGFTREECKYANFINNNLDILNFSTDEGSGVLISIPITDDAPECIKEILNDMLYREMNKKIEESGYEYVVHPKLLNLEARMQINYDHEQGSKYYISINVTENTYPFNWDINTDYEVKKNSSVANEFIKYCQHRLISNLFGKKETL